MKRLVSTTLGRQSLWHFSAQIVNAALGFAVLAMLTRAMSIEDFGTYSWAITAMTFLSMFFDMGLFTSGARLMAVSDPEVWHARAAALIAASAGLGVLLAACTAIASFAAEPLFGANAARVLLLLSPLAMVFPLQEMLLSIAQGANRIRFLAVLTMLPRLFLMPTLLVLLLTTGITLDTAVLATLGFMGIAALAGIRYLRPAFGSMRGQFGAIRKEVREFGRDMYAGRVIDGLTSGLDKMLISLYYGMASLGAYTVAATMVSPVGMFSRAVAASAYKRFAWKRSIARAILLGNLAWCTVGTAVLVLACETLIPLVFPGKYGTSLPVLPWLAAGIALMGLNSPFHSFLAAQRQGKSIRTMSIVTSALNVTANLVLVPLYSMAGAAAALLATYAVNLAMNLFYYRAHINRIAEHSDAL